MAVRLKTDSLSKPRGSGVFKSTKLCETMSKSSIGRQFDSSQPQAGRVHLEYNSLRDPCLINYFYKPDMIRKLIVNRYVSCDLRVLCGKRDYTNYHSYIEDEFARLRKGREQEIKQAEEKLYLSKITDLPKKKKKTIFSSVDREYEKTRIQYIAKAEKDLLARKIALQKLDMEHAVNRRKELEYNHFLRVKEEMKKETEIDRDNIRKLRKEYKEAILKKSESCQIELRDQIDFMDSKRKEKEQMIKKIKEFESRWKNYEDIDASNKVEQREKQILEDHQNRVMQRERQYYYQQEKAKEYGSNKVKRSGVCLQMIKDQARERKKEWDEVRKRLVSEGGALQRQCKQWEVQLIQRKEAWRKEHEKLFRLMMGEEVVESRKPSASGNQKEVKWGREENDDDDDDDDNCVVDDDIKVVDFKACGEGGCGVDEDENVVINVISNSEENLMISLIKEDQANVDEGSDGAVDGSERNIASVAEGSERNIANNSEGDVASVVDGSVIHDGDVASIVSDGNFFETEAVADEAIDEAIDESVVDEVPDDEAVVIEAVDEVALDEVAVDESVVDEAIVDEAIVDEDEAIVDEAVVDETAVEEVAGEAVVDETADEVADEAVEEVADEAVVDETADEVADEAVVDEAVVDEAIVDEAVVDEAVDEVIDEAVVDKAIVDEAVVDEAVDEAVDEVIVDEAVDEVIDKAVDEPVDDEAVDKGVDEILELEEKKSAHEEPISNKVHEEAEMMLEEDDGFY